MKKRAENSKVKLKGESQIETKRYLPEEVPNHLFTGNKLSQMGLVNTEDHVAWVVYPEQKREYKLYDISSTKKRKKQKNNGFLLTRTNMSVEEVLKEREHEMKVRLGQLGKYYGITATPQLPEQKN